MQITIKTKILLTSEPQSEILFSFISSNVLETLPVAGSIKSKNDSSTT